MSAFYGNCPSCNNPWNTCKCSIPSSIMSAGSAGFSSGLSSGTWVGTGACPSCFSMPCNCAFTQHQHAIYTPSIYTYTCPTCHNSPLSCICKTYLTTGTGNIAYPFLHTEYIYNIKFTDIHDVKLSIDSSGQLNVIEKDDKAGFKGSLGFLQLPDLFDNYFVTVGKAWQILSPLLFKLDYSIMEKDQLIEKSHFVTVMDFKEITRPIANSVLINNLEIREVKDNFTFLKLASIDKEFRKKILA